MNFSVEWDSIYKEGKQLAIWPMSDLVSYVMRHAKPSGNQFRVLEIGCGAGANIPFFLSLGVEYFGVEGSSFIVDSLIKRFPMLSDSIKCGDFTIKIPFEGQFDLVVDRSSLTHNSTDAIKKCLNIVSKRLKVGGKYIGIDWFSTNHSEYNKGIVAVDNNTKTDFKNGQFKDVGNVHFSDKTHTN